MFLLIVVIQDYQPFWFAWDYRTGLGEGGWWAVHFRVMELSVINVGSSEKTRQVGDLRYSTIPGSSMRKGLTHQCAQCYVLKKPAINCNKFT